MFISTAFSLYCTNQRLFFMQYNFSSKYILEILFFRDIIFVWGISAVGSAPHSHCGGHGFESRILHQRKPLIFSGFSLFLFDFATLSSHFVMRLTF